MRPYLKGKYYEYQLFTILKKQGYFVIRTPASGAGHRKSFYPDLFCIRNGKVLGIEVKMRADDRDIYIEKDKFGRLKWVEGRYGIKMYLCVWYKFVRGFRCVELSNYSETTNEYVVYRREDILKKGAAPELLF